MGPARLWEMVFVPRGLSHARFAYHFFLMSDNQYLRAFLILSSLFDGAGSCWPGIVEGRMAFAMRWVGNLEREAIENHIMA